MSTIAVGMSAGVDSTTTAKLLKEQGNNVFGVTMLHWNGDERAPLSNSCYGPYQKNIVEECEKYAKQIGIEYFTFNLSDIYQKKVIDYVIESYKMGLTPNPCIMCNSLIKFARGNSPSAQHLTHVLLLCVVVFIFCARPDAG